MATACKIVPDELIEQVQLGPDHWHQPWNSRRKHGESGTLPQAENIITSYLESTGGLTVRETADASKEGSYYNNQDDVIFLPRRETFKALTFFYHTQFHELVHSTSYFSRLNRPVYTEAAYSFEEIIAEIGANILDCNAGFAEPFENSIQYVDNWITGLAIALTGFPFQPFNSPRDALNAAAREAQYSVDYIMKGSGN